jgi:cytochrome c-type biogenesis protein CcmH/NrfF
MRRIALWVGPPAAVVAGVTLWFTLVPGRSGAG